MNKYKKIKYKVNSSTKCSNNIVKIKTSNKKNRINYYNNNNNKSISKCSNFRRSKTNKRHLNRLCFNLNSFNSNLRIVRLLALSKIYHNSSSKSQCRANKSKSQNQENHKTLKAKPLILKNLNISVIPTCLRTLQKF